MSYDHIYNPKIHTFKFAASNGDIKMLDWLQENGKLTDIKYWASEFASENGYLEVVKWLHDNNFYFYQSSMDYAAKNGHMNVLKWLNENRKEGFSEYALIYAYDNEHLEILKWLESFDIYKLEYKE